MRYGWRGGVGGGGWEGGGDRSPCASSPTRAPGPQPAPSLPPLPPPSQAARKTWGVKGGDAAALAAHRQKQLRRWEARAQGLSVDDDEDAAEKTMGDLGKAVLASFGLVAVVALRSRVRF